MINKRSYKFLVSGFLLLAIGLAFYLNYYFQRKKERENVFVQVRPIHTAIGWGYEIITDGKTYIRQEFIPAMQNKHGFRTKEDALKVGHKVISKISMRQSPPS